MIRPDEIYGARLPSYFRADVRVTKRDGQIALQRDNESGFIILPSLGISWAGSFFGR